MSRYVLSMIACALLTAACGVEEFGDAQYDRPKNQPSVASGGDENSYGGATSDEVAPTGAAGFNAGGAPASDPVTDAGSTAGDTRIILL